MGKTITSATVRFGDYACYFPDNQSHALFEPIMIRLLRSPESLEGYRPIHQRKGKPVKVFRFRCGENSFVAKWSRSHSQLERIRKLLRPPRARTAWQSSSRLLALGFDTPRPVAYTERRSAGFVRRALLITEEVPQSSTLHQFLIQLGADPQEQQLRRELMRLLGTLVGRLHRAGVFQSDLRSANILVQRQPEGLRLWLVDTEAVRFYQPISESRRLKNLGSLSFTFVPGLTTTDRLRVFRSYADTFRMDRSTRKAWMLKTIRACERSMHEKVFKPKLRPYRTPSGLAYRAQVKAITEALQSRPKQKSGAPAADPFEESD